MKKDGPIKKKTTTTALKTVGTGRGARVVAGPTVASKPSTKKYAAQPSGTVTRRGTGNAMRYGAVKK